MPGKCLKDLFIESALVHSEKTAITFFRGSSVETEVSYLELHQDSNRMAALFLDMGVQKGDRVILFLEKSLVFVVAHIALQKIGAISVPLNPGFKKSEMSYFINDAGAKLILAGKKQQQIVRETAPRLPTISVNTEVPYQALDFFRSFSDMLTEIEVGPQDPGLIVYTSGTTGRPKGAILTQKNLVHDAINIIDIWEISDSDVLCHALPLFHVHGLCFALHTSLMAGAHVLMIDRFSPDRVIERLTEKEGKYVATIFMAVPPMYVRLLEYIGHRKMDFHHLRLLTSGSAPLLPKDFERIRETFGKEPVEREGMSETGMNFSNPVRGIRKPGSIGTPLPHLKVRIVDPVTFKDVEAGQTGEIWLKGPGITPGYWRKPRETAEAFENGWFRTGDLGKVDGDGYYYLTDRLKHIIISGGENISPKEIEGVINQLDEVIESSVVGIPDEKWGEKVVAAVVPRHGRKLAPEEIKAHCKKYLHDWKCPKEVIFLEALPKNTMGKVMKQEIKKFFEHRHTGEKPTE